MATKKCDRHLFMMRAAFCWWLEYRTSGFSFVHWSISLVTALIIWKSWLLCYESVRLRFQKRRLCHTWSSTACWCRLGWILSSVISQLFLTIKSRFEGCRSFCVNAPLRQGSTFSPKMGVSDGRDEARSELIALLIWLVTKVRRVMIEAMLRKKGQEDGRSECTALVYSAFRL